MTRQCNAQGIRLKTISLQGIFEAHVHRFVIDLSDWSLESSEDILDGPMTVEMSNINMDFAGLPYTYAYMIKGLFTGQQNVLMKVNKHLSTTF